MCEWKKDVEGIYNTTCDKVFYFDDSSNVEENEFKFCPFCGELIGIKDAKEPTNQQEQLLSSRPTGSKGVEVSCTDINNRKY